MALGSILTLAGYLLATLAGDVTAQPETDKNATFDRIQPDTKNATFDKIVCRELQVVNANGKMVVGISAGDNDGAGFIRVKDADSKAIVVIDADSAGGGAMLINNADGKTAVFMSANSTGGGGLLMYTADGKSTVGMSAGSKSGLIWVNHADGKTAVNISTNDAGNGGQVSVLSKDTKGAIQLSVDEEGGDIGIYSNTDNKTRVRLGINERGNGTINTWDKNGYRTRP